MEDDWKLDPTEKPKSFKIKMIKKESILSVMIYCFARFTVLQVSSIIQLLKKVHLFI